MLILVVFDPPEDVDKFTLFYERYRKKVYYTLDKFKFDLHKNCRAFGNIDIIILTSAVTSIYGTATLYKKNASGSYVEFDTEKLSFKGSTVDYTGHLASSGSGNYKIEFVAAIYTNSGNDSVTF